MTLRNKLYTVLILLSVCSISLLTAWRINEERRISIHRQFQLCESLALLLYQATAAHEAAVAKILTLSDPGEKAAPINALLQPAVNRTCAAFPHARMGVYINKISSIVAFGPGFSPRGLTDLPDSAKRRLAALEQPLRFEGFSQIQDRQVLAYVQPLYLPAAGSDVAGYIWVSIDTSHIDSYLHTFIIESILISLLFIVFSCLGIAAVMRHFDLGVQSFIAFIRNASREKTAPPYPQTYLPELKEIYQAMAQSWQALNRQRSFLQLLLETVPVGVVGIDINGTVVFINQSAAKIMRQPGACAGDPYEKLLETVNVSCQQSLVLDSLHTGTLHRNQIVFDNVVADTAPIYDYNGSIQGALAVLNDLSHLRHMEQAAMHGNKFRVLSELAASISHEIKNPLTAIEGYMRLLHLQKLSPETAEMLQAIALELDRAMNITLEFLQLSCPRRLTLAPLLLTNTLEDVMRIMNGFAKTHQVRLSLDADCNPMIMGDESQLKQALINFIKNAIEACSPDQVVQLTLTADDRFAVITIADKGCGMDENQLRRLGEMFYTTKETGSGLGLPIALAAISLHHGTTDFSSRPQQGTTVTIALPLT